MRKAPFFNYISDSTQDIYKIEQQSDVFYYVNVIKKKLFFCTKYTVLSIKLL